MSSQNYSNKTLGKVDERQYTESVTKDIINNDIRLEVNGNNSVTFYDINVVDEVDYVRSGTSRFGQMVELGDGQQTKTLSQDKSFTFSVDQGNLEDSEMVTEAHKAVKRQVREVSIPNTDKYRLATLQAYAIANGQSNTTAITASNAYQLFLARVAALVNAEFAREDIICYLSPTNYNFMKRDPEFKSACSEAYRDTKKGVLGMVDGVELREVPESYLPANTGFLMTSRKVLVSPTKFDMIRVLTEQRGIHGAVAEGRRYYDAWIPKNKGEGIQVQMVA